MKKIFTFAAVAAVVLSSCAKVDNYKVSAPEAISFGVYAGNTVNTKAVSNTDFGTVTTASLQDAASNGFGIFAYYTDNKDYASDTKANFMYNQQVTYSGGNWTYSPIKYWPNEHGTSAKSDEVDKLTFLAYAPFVTNLAINGDTESTVNDGSAAAATEGIIKMTGNKMAEDAKLTFVVPASAEEQIDLLYGTLGAKSVNVDGAEEGTVGGAIENLTKQKTDGKVNIKFKHALAKVAINIKDVVDQKAPTSTIDPDAGTEGKFTKVFVESVTLKGTDLGTGGKLNLYTGAWANETTSTSFSITPLPSDIYAANPTTYLDKPGVQETGLAKTIDLMLVPVHGGTSNIDRVDIVYYVCTKDDNLDGGVSVVKNTIYKTGLDIDIEQGKQYGLNILLGLTSVDVTATVADWDTTPGSQDVDLPQNVTPAP